MIINLFTKEKEKIQKNSWEEQKICKRVNNVDYLKMKLLIIIILKIIKGYSLCKINLPKVWWTECEEYGYIVIENRSGIIWNDYC